MLLYRLLYMLASGFVSYLFRCFSSTTGSISSSRRWRLLPTETSSRKCKLYICIWPGVRSNKPQCWECFRDEWKLQPSKVHFIQQQSWKVKCCLYNFGCNKSNSVLPLCFMAILSPKSKLLWGYHSMIRQVTFRNLRWEIKQTYNGRNTTFFYGQHLCICVHV